MKNSMSSHQSRTPGGDAAQRPALSRVGRTRSANELVAVEAPTGKGSQMRLSNYLSDAKRLRVGAVSVVTLAILLSAGLFATTVGAANATATTVPLGTTESFVVLAGSGVTNTGPTTLNGDIGTYPTKTITGTSTLTVTGTNHGGDGVTQNAKNDLVTAYNTAAGEGPRTAVSTLGAGQTLKPGVYNSASSLLLNGALTLDGEGNPDAVFVFQVGSALTTGSASVVNLTNGAQSCNIFWQIGSSATLGTGSFFRGTIFALTSITVTTGTTIEGRVLARNGAVTLDTDTITKPTCKTTPPTTTTTAGGPTTTTTAGSTTTTTPGGGSTTTTTPGSGSTTTTTPGTGTPTTTTKPGSGPPHSYARPPLHGPVAFTG